MALKQMPALKNPEVKLQYWIQRQDKSGLLPCYNKQWVTTLSPYSQSRTGYYYEDWKERIAKKQDASTSYVRTRLRISENVPGIWDSPNTLGTASCNTVYPYLPQYPLKLRYIGTPWGGICDQGLNAIDDDPVYAQKADADLRKKYNRRKPDFNAVVPIGEWRESVGLYNKLVNDTFAYANKAYNLLNYATTRKRYLRLLARAGDYWLAYAFGIKPTLQDLRSAAMDIARKTAGGPGTPSMVVRGEAVKQWNQTIVINDVWADTSGYLKGVGIQRISHECIYRSVMGFEAISPIEDNYELAQSVFKPSFQEVVLGLYDLVPWSFLLDYFTSTGEWLEGQFQLDTRPYYGTKSRLYTCETSYDFIPKNGWKTIYPHRHVVQFTRYTRQLGTTLQARKLEFKSPAEIVSLNKLANLAALFVTNRASNAARQNTDFVRNRRDYII